MSGISDNSHALWSTLAHTTGAAAGHDTCMVGIWDPVGGTFLDGSTAALSLINARNLASAAAALANADWDKSSSGTSVLADDTDLTGAGGVVNVRPSSPQWLNNQFQIVQAMPSGNPIASPIIHSNQVKRLSYNFSVEPVLHQLDIDTDAGLNPVVEGDTMKLILRIHYTNDVAFYEAQVNPSGSVTSVTPALSNAFNNPQRIYKVEVAATNDTEADQSAVLVAAINADPTVSQLVTATDDGDGLLLEAKFFGTVLNATVTKNGDTAGVVLDNSGDDMTIGVGSYAEVLSAEKKAQYSQGHFNRMYLPTGGVTMASTTAGGLSSETALYNRLVIEYVNGNSAMPGFNAQGNTSTVTLYTPRATFANEDTGKGLEAVFGLQSASDTNVEYIW